MHPWTHVWICRLASVFTAVIGSGIIVSIEVCSWLEYLWSELASLFNSYIFFATDSYLHWHVINRKTLNRHLIHLLLDINLICIDNIVDILNFLAFTFIMLCFRLLVNLPKGIVKRMRLNTRTLLLRFLTFIIFSFFIFNVFPKMLLMLILILRH